MQPETKFTQIGGDRIAYQVVGEGPDLLYVSEIGTNLDLRWEELGYAAVLRRLASFSRLILFDRRGVGVSDPAPAEVFRWESGAEDIRAVLDAAGSERASLLAGSDSGPAAMLFAASQPARVASLILWNTSARFVAGDDYEAGFGPEIEQMLRVIEDLWGTEDFADVVYPSMAGNEPFRRWNAKYQRAGCRPREFAAYNRSLLLMDVRHVLPLIQAPTLVLHRGDAGSGGGTPPAQGRYVAEHIPDAKFVLLPGGDLGFPIDPSDEMIDHIEEFITGTTRRLPDIDRVLATVVFTDIVGSTDLAHRLGDRRWKALLAEHDERAAASIDRFRGRLVKTTGDGVLATFDGPGRAIRCAFALIGGLRDLGIEIRAGLHSGEVELREDGDVGGIGVHIAARVMAEAAAGEVLASRTVKDLVAGSGFSFEDRGIRTLKGVPEPWQLFSVSAA